MITRHFVSVPEGVIHCAIAGTGRPVLLLHQTPRSWDEYREVLPLLGQHCQAIAMDTLGYGDSSRPPIGNDSIEYWAQVAISLLDALGIERATVVGHHTGAVIAVELAAMYPQRIEAAVLSACPLIDEVRRAAQAVPSHVDNVVRRSDGSHLGELWGIRQPWYPHGDIDLLERFIVDAIKAGPRAAGGHAVCARYEMEVRLPKISCPVLIVAPTDDPHAYPAARPVAARIAGSRVIEIEGGMVPLPDQMPQQFARLVLDFMG